MPNYPEWRNRPVTGAVSVIASMAGRPIVRPAELALIGTTSLYGERPSQYDRIAVPVGGASGGDSGGLRPPIALGGKCVRYEYLGRTLGLGTFHFGDQTVKELALLLAQSHRGQQVNSVFGEGVNPRLRKLRDSGITGKPCRAK